MKNIEQIQIQQKIADTIIKESIDFFNVNIFEDTKKERVIYPRFMTIYLICEFCPLLTLQYIGDLFNRGHDTMINAKKRAYNLIKYNAEFRDTYQQLFFNVDAVVEELHEVHYKKQLKMKLISKINKSLRSMDIILLNNLKTIINEWNQLNGKESTKNISHLN